MSLAIQQSQQAKAAKASRDVAQVQADRDRPVARPTLTVVAAGTAQGPRVTFPRPDYTSATVLPEAAGRLDLILEQTLYHAGIGAARQRYVAEAALATEDYRKALTDLAQAARKAYLDVLRAESGVRLAQDGLDAALRYQQLVETQIRAGVAKPIDAETVRAQVAEAQESVQIATGSQSIARSAFNRTVGRPLNTPLVLDRVDAPPDIPPSPDAAIAYAQQNRPELITLELNLRAAQAGVSLARTQTQPTLTARGQVTEQTPTAFLHEHYYAATLEVRWPLLDGGKARQDTREAQAQVARLEALRDDTRQGIALDVSVAWQRMRDASAQIESARVRVNSLQATAMVAAKSYEVGKGTVLEVQAAQREVRTARAAELKATYDLHAAALDFAHAQGQDVRDVDSVVEKK